MKAVCLLLCLALARHSAGSIFNRRHNPSIDLVVQSAGYLEPYVQSEQYQEQREQQSQEQQRVQEQLYPQQQRSQQQRYQQEQVQEQLRREQEQEQRYQQQGDQEQQQQRYQQQGEQEQQRFQQQGYQQQQRGQQQRYQQQYLQQNQGETQQPEQSKRKYNQDNSQSQEEQWQEQKQRRQGQTIRRNANSASSESQEAIQTPSALTGNQYEQFAMPLFADLDTPMTYSRADASELSYGDVVAWRGLEVASNPNSPVEKKDIEKIFRRAQETTKHIQPETKNKLHHAVQVAMANSEDARLNATELLKKYQYPVEEHTIQTEDGYYLTLFRIPPKQQSLEEKPTKAVFLMHGLLGSADDWLLMGPGKSLPYLLADAGYDVYLGNARGNRYTRHASKHRAHPDFWQYSNDEIALYDLPAMIDHVLKVSRQQKMYFVGHSQGTTAFFAMAAARPEYNEKIAVMYALSPMVYMAGVRSPLVRMIAPSSKFYDNLSQLGEGEFKPSKEVVQTIGGAMCENEIGCKNICSNVYFVMAGPNVQNMEPAQIASILSHLPAGGSMKQMKQYGQAVDSHDFRMYDYGTEMNKKVYGQPQPPKYNMEKVTAPVMLYYSKDDWLANPKDVERLRKELPNATAHKIPQDYFSNMDFQNSKQAPEMVNKNLIESIQKHRSNKQQGQNNKQQQQKQEEQQQQLTSY